MFMQQHIGRFGLVAVAFAAVTFFGLPSSSVFADGEIAQLGAYQHSDNNLALIDRRYITNSSDFEKRRSRKTRYHGPGLEFNQISRKTEQNANVSRRYRRSGLKKPDYQQKQLGSGGLSVFTQQLRAQGKIIGNVVVPGLHEKKRRHCELPPGTYTVEGLMIPTIPGVPPIAIINSLNDKKEEDYDPNSLFIRPEKKDSESDQPDYGIKIEAEPYVDVTVGVTLN
ncbi:MAG: hypothetical protein ACRBBN_06690 [Methyloligellaceae bacterium]